MDGPSKKLEILENYLVAYGKIFQINPRAKPFDTIYVDAFAGTGLITQRKDAAKGAKLVANPDGARPVKIEWIREIFKGVSKAKRSIFL